MINVSINWWKSIYHKQNDISINEFIGIYFYASVQTLYELMNNNNVYSLYNIVLLY